MTTDEQSAFIAAIVASPDDDLPRLVYADWLEEHGKEDRAAFIRVQIALSRKDFSRCSQGHDWRRVNKSSYPVPVSVCDTCGVDGPFWPDIQPDIDLRKRESELIRSTDAEMYNLYHRACWPPSRFTFRRGFLDTVRCEVGDWIGKPCPNCIDQGADYETGIVECGRCECTGEIGRMGPTILQDFPTVRLVEIDDFDPAGDDGNGWYWFDDRQNRTGFRSFHHLPEPLYTRLDGGTVNGNVRLYGTREQAVTALSDACIRFAKEDVH